MERINILITGCGGDIGQSIGKALKGFPLLDKMYGTDLHKKHAGIFIFDQCHIIERASSPDYLSVLAALVARLEVDVVIPVTEYELEFFAQHKLDKVGDALLVKPNDHIIGIGLDKWNTVNTLKELGLPSPVTSLADDLEQGQPFPAIVKSRTGSGSKQVVKVADQAELDLYLKLIPNAIVQECIPDIQGEYTCGLFRSKEGITRFIILKRELLGGFTGYAEVVRDPRIESLLKSIAESLKLEGSINVQLRLDGDDPKVFEINPRFSSTVYFRHLMGFTDVIWSLEDVLGLPLASYMPVKSGTRIYKGFMEYISES